MWVVMDVPLCSMTKFHEIGGYEVLGTLGQGARSTIYRVADATGHTYALKRVVKADADDQRFIDQAIAEHQVASALDHPRLRRSLKLIKQRQLIRLSEVLVLMELLEGKTLEKVEPNDLGRLCRIFCAAAEGLTAMHEAGYVHADIKPNNIMVLAGDEVKLIDFGQSCAIGTTKQRIQGTPDYIAPEQVLRHPITPQTDVFNLGATMYWMLTGRHVPTLIPKGEPGVRLRAPQEALQPPEEHNPAVPPALSKLVLNCVQTALEDRPADMSQVLSRLEVSCLQIDRRNGREIEPQAGNSGSTATRLASRTSG